MPHPVIAAIELNPDPEPRTPNPQILESGNAKTIMLAAISPADINFEESLSTLQVWLRVCVCVYMPVDAAGTP